MKVFSLISLIVIATIAGFAGSEFKHLTTETLVQMVERENRPVAEKFAEKVWKNFRSAVIIAAESTDPEARNQPQITQFAQETLRFFQDMPLLRVNLYNAKGRLILTLDMDASRKLGGDKKSPDFAFITQLIGSAGIASKITASTINQSEAMVVQTVFSSATDGSPDLMIEMIDDVTQPMARQQELQMIGTGGVIVLFLVFLGLLFLSSRRAENIIARQHEANMDLSAAAAAAQAENLEKSQFLANISHELRTPLNAIIGFSDIIRIEVMPMVENQKYKDYINDINSSGVHLLSLINDILDYSKAEAGKLEMEVSEVNATKLVQNSMRLVEPRAEIAKVKLRETLPKEHIIMITDSKKFKQILLNLLSNAVKFTPPGGEVRISAWRDLADDTVSYEVRDTGIGIAPKDISRAMSPFGQVDSALSRKYEGTGLGLPLTKKFVELMGGKFAIESQVGKGTTVTFTLPRELKDREGVIIKQAT